MQRQLPNEDKEMTKIIILIVLFRQYAAFINIHIANIYIFTIYNFHLDKCLFVILDLYNMQRQLPNEDK